MKTNEFKDWNIKQLQKELNKKLSFLPNNQKKDLLKFFLNIIVNGNLEKH